MFSSIMELGCLQREIRVELQCYPNARPMLRLTPTMLVQGSCFVQEVDRSLETSPPTCPHIFQTIAHSVASAVLPSSPPPLLPERAVEDRLPELLVDFIMGIAQPISKLGAAAGLHGVFLDVGLEILGTNPARI